MTRWKMAHRATVERSVKINEHFAIAVEGGPTFAFLPAGRESRVDLQLKNAILIKNAPELLIALKNLVSQACDSCPEFTSNDGTITKKHTRECIAARELIASIE